MEVEDGDEESSKKSEKSPEAGFEKESETRAQEKSQACGQESRTLRLRGLRPGGCGGPGLRLRPCPQADLLQQSHEKEVTSNK